MNMENIRDMFEYNYWANQRILDTAEKVTPEQLIAPTSCSYGSLFGTLVHTLDAEWGWRLLLQGEQSDPLLTPADFPTLAALRLRWDEDEVEMWKYLDDLKDDDLTSILRYPIGEGKMRERVNSSPRSSPGSSISATHTSSTHPISAASKAHCGGDNSPASLTTTV